MPPTPAVSPQVQLGWHDLRRRRQLTAPKEATIGPLGDATRPTFWVDERRQRVSLAPHLRPECTQ